MCQHTHAGKVLWLDGSAAIIIKIKEKTIIIILIKKCNNIMLMYKTLPDGNGYATRLSGTPSPLKRLDVTENRVPKGGKQKMIRKNVF